VALKIMFHWSIF